MPSEYLSFDVKLINNSDKKISEARFAAFFKQRGADPYDFTCKSSEEECYSNPDLSAGYQKIIKLRVDKPRDPDLIFKYLKLQTIVFEDGTFIEY